MLTYVAGLLLGTLVYGPWKDPEGMNFPQSRMFSAWETVDPLLAGTRIHIGVPIALVVALAAALLVERTLLGFEIKVAGLAPSAAQYAGFRRDRVVWLAFLLSGGLAGLAGMLEVAGPIGQLVPVITPSYGFTAIIVAFLGRLNPLGIIAAGVLMALSYVGGENAQIAVGLPRAATDDRVERRAVREKRLGGHVPKCANAGNIGLERGDRLVHRRALRRPDAPGLQLRHGRAGAADAALGRAARGAHGGRARARRGRRRL